MSLSLVNAVCSQAEFSVSGRSLAQTSPTECVSVMDCDQVEQ